VLEACRELQLSPNLCADACLQRPVKSPFLVGSFDANGVTVYVGAATRSAAGGVDDCSTARVAHDPDQAPLPRLLPARNAGADGLIP